MFQGDQRGRYRGTCCSGDQAQRWPRTGDFALKTPVVVVCLLSCVKINRWIFLKCFFMSLGNLFQIDGFENSILFFQILSQWSNFRSI